MHSHSVLLILIVAIVLVKARTIHQIQNENDYDEDQTGIFHSNHNLNQPQKIEEILNILLRNKPSGPQEYDRFSAFAKRAKAIVKGDPREFMG